MEFRTGVTKDGTITGLHMRTLIDGGAYGSCGVASTYYAGALQTTTYHIPRYRYEGCRTFTNKPPCGPKRGHGTPQPRFGQEVQLDKIAERLRIDPADLRLRIVETPNTVTANFLSLGTVNLGECIRRVVEASDWKTKFRKLPEGRGVGMACSAEAVALKFEVPKERLPFAGKRVFDSATPDEGVSFAEAICLAEPRFGTIDTVGSYTPPKSPALYKGGGVGPSPTYSYSAAVVEVEVNPVTGWVIVPKVWIAHDIGRALNPTLVRGQVEGSVYMGLGEALMEEQEFRRLPKRLSHALVHKFPSMLEYKSPTSLDMPDVVTELVEEPDPRGPFGAKEVGQGPLLPIMPAVANAVYDAVGVRIDEVPITPEKIMKALGEKKAGRNPRYGPSHFPHVDWPEALRVPPPWEGGDGNAVNDVPRRSKPRPEKEKVLSS